MTFTYFCYSLQYLLFLFVVTYCCRRLRQFHLQRNDDVSFRYGWVSLFTGNFGDSSLICLQCTLSNKSALQTVKSAL